MSLLELLVRERPPLPLFWYLYLGAPVLIGTGTWILLGRRNDLRNPKRLPHPPGPKGLPLLGNLFQLPQTYTWLTFADWAKQYGDIVYTEALGQPMIVLNSLPDAIELLEKRSNNYSDRPSIPAIEMMNLGWSFGVMSYTPLWRAHRKAFYQSFNHTVVPEYRPIIEEETRTFLRKLLSNPGDFLDASRRLFGLIIMRVSYGGDEEEYNRKLIDQVEIIVEGFTALSIPGRYLVNIFPVLRHVPSWFPGAGWKREFSRIAAVCEKALHGPFDDVKERNRNAVQNQYTDAASRLIDELPSPEDSSYAEQERIAKGTVLNAYLGGADTTVSSAHALLLALAMNPAIQARAQEEIDTISGADRLPTANDCTRMPYLQAMVKEVIRWHSVTPITLAHTTREDDEYKGYFIPKGSFVVPNSWAILHDVQRFGDPMEFRPERYLKDGKIDPSVLDPEDAAFGFGRRKCPGLHFNREALTYMAAATLAVFDVRPPKDAVGNPIPLEFKVESGLISKPTPFHCEILPRSPKHAAMLSQ